jgi:hypothetical protein
MREACWLGGGPTEVMVSSGCMVFVLLIVSNQTIANKHSEVKSLFMNYPAKRAVQSSGAHQRIFQFN